MQNFYGKDAKKIFDNAIEARGIKHCVTTMIKGYTFGARAVYAITEDGSIQKWILDTSGRELIELSSPK